MEPRLLESILAAQKCSTISDAELADYERERHAQERRERMAQSGISKVIPSLDVDAIRHERFERTHMLDAVQRWLVNARPVDRSKVPGPHWLFLCGAMGRGKTFAAAWAIAQETGRYVKFDRLIQDYERFVKDRTWDGRASKSFEAYARSSLLVVDELGTERDADQELAREALRWLVDRRQSPVKQLTIVCSNLTRDQLRSRFEQGVYDPRSIDRLQRMAVTREDAGPSMRAGAPGRRMEVVK